MSKKASFYRCPWAESSALMIYYHDAEWGVPEYDSRALWELLMLEGFQAGLSWAIVLKKRAAFRKAFKRFDPVKVSKFKAKDVRLLMKNEGIIRSKAKILATIGGARAYLKMMDEGLDFADWVWGLCGGKPIQRRGPRVDSTPLAALVSDELKLRGFKFVGPVIVYAWMQAAGIVNDHATACFRRDACASLGKKESLNVK